MKIEKITREHLEGNMIKVFDSYKIVDQIEAITITFANADQIELRVYKNEGVWAPAGVIHKETQCPFCKSIGIGCHYFKIEKNLYALYQQVITHPSLRLRMLFT